MRHIRRRAAFPHPVQHGATLLLSAAHAAGASYAEAAYVRVAGAGCVLSCGQPAGGGSLFFFPGSTGGDVMICEAPG